MMQSRRWHFAFRDGQETLGAQSGLGVLHMNCVPSCARLSSPGKVGRNAFGSELRSVVAVAAADMSENRCQSRDGALLRCYHSELLVASSGSESTLSPKSQS